MICGLELLTAIALTLPEMGVAPKVVKGAWLPIGLGPNSAHLLFAIEGLGTVRAVERISPVARFRVLVLGQVAAASWKKAPPTTTKIITVTRKILLLSIFPEQGEAS